MLWERPKALIGWQCMGSALPPPMYRRIHMAIQNGRIKHIADSINVDMEVVVYVQDANGNDVECEVEPRDDAVWVTIPLPADTACPDSDRHHRRSTRCYGQRH